MKIRSVAAVLIGGLSLGWLACQDEGPAERAGKQIDEAMKEATEGAEGTLEQLGREMDEAAKEVGEAAREMEEAAKQATE